MGHPQSFWSFFREMSHGMMSVLTVNNPPLYRYPYRTSAEAFRGDFKRIGTDISEVFQSLESHEKSE